MPKSDRALSIPDLEKMCNQPMPHAAEMEAAVIGSLLLRPDAVGVVSEIIDKEDFYDDRLAAIYGIILREAESGGDQDRNTIAQLLHEAELLESIGGSEVLEELMAASAGGHMVETYATKMKAVSTIRRFMMLCWEDLYTCQNQGSVNIEETIDEHESQLIELRRREQQEKPVTMVEMMAEAYDRVKERRETQAPAGLTTGFPRLDTLLGGLHPGQLVLVAARPAIGKSSLLSDIAVHMGTSSGGKEPIPVGFISLEMGRVEMTERWFSALANVKMTAIRTNILSDEQLEHLRDAKESLRSSKLVFDSPRRTLMHIRSRSKDMYRRYKIECLFVDYIQLITDPGSSNRDGRVQEVGRISSSLKEMARVLQIPIICACQLNRAPETRTDNEPKLYDLRESGSLEMDSDVVMLLNRPNYHVTGGDTSEATLVVAKNRNGPTGSVELTFYEDQVTFTTRQLAHIQTKAF